MSIDLGPFTRISEARPTMRVYEVRTGNRYLHGLEDGEIRCWPDFHRFIIDEGTGFVSIEGSYGSWSYYWTARGGESLHAFLYDLDFDYFMKKASKQPHRVPDHNKTIAALKNDLISVRKEAGGWKSSRWTKDRVREMWNDMLSWSGDYQGADFVRKLYEEGAWWELLDCSDPTVMIDSPAMRRWWNEVWKPFREEVLRPHWLDHAKLRPLPRYRALVALEVAA